MNFAQRFLTVVALIVFMLATIMLASQMQPWNYNPAGPIQFNQQLARLGVAWVLIGGVYGGLLLLLKPREK